MNPPLYLYLYLHLYLYFPKLQTWPGGRALAGVGLKPRCTPVCEATR